MRLRDDPDVFLTTASCAAISTGFAKRDHRARDRGIMPVTNARQISRITGMSGDLSAARFKGHCGPVRGHPAAIAGGNRPRHGADYRPDRQRGQRNPRVFHEQARRGGQDQGRTCPDSGIKIPGQQRDGGVPMMDIATVNRREVLATWAGGGGPGGGRACGSVPHRARGGLRAAVSDRGDPLALGQDGTVDGGCFSVKSHSLSKNLADCHGLSCLRLPWEPGGSPIRKYSVLRMSQAVAMQAGGGHDRGVLRPCLRGSREEYEAGGEYLRPRFSPGYRDFPLACQPSLLNAWRPGLSGSS